MISVNQKGFIAVDCCVGCRINCSDHYGQSSSSNKESEFGVQLFDQHVFGLWEIVDLVKRVLNLFFFECVSEIRVEGSIDAQGQCCPSLFRLEPLVLPH